MNAIGKVLLALLLGAGCRRTEPPPTGTPERTEIKRIPLGEARYKLLVGPVEEDLALVVLSAELEGAPASSAAAVRSGTGAAIPAQVERRDGRTRVFFTVEELKKGATGEWTLELGEKAAASHRITARPSPDGRVAIEVGGALFTRLVADPKEAKPYLYPVILDGAYLTRRYPMEDFPGEDRDHPHHRSLWLTHGEVEDEDFWAEGGRKGRIHQREVAAAEGGDVFARIATRNDWITHEKEKLLEEEREMRFYDFGPAGRMIDFTSVLTAREDPVTFGDTKEGSFGIRLAETMKEKRGGRIESSRGAVGMKAAWGKPAEWVDYSGKVEDKTFGIAILDHPSSFRHPTTWHVRDYGLFAANPFGLRDFTGDSKQDGSHRLSKGDSIRFRYRIFLHHGDAASAKVAAAYSAFARPPQVKVEQIR